MNEPAAVPSKKNWIALASIVVAIIGILSFAIYIIGSMQFLNVYLFSLFSSALGIVLGVVGLVIGFFVKEGRGRAIVGIALSAINAIILSASS